MPQHPTHTVTTIQAGQAQSLWGCLVYRSMPAGSLPRRPALLSKLLGLPLIRPWPVTCVINFETTKCMRAKEVEHQGEHPLPMLTSLSGLCALF